MYHSVSRPGTPDLRPPGYWTTPEIFEAHLEALSSAGAAAVGLSDLLCFHRGEKTLPPRPVVITFDDGYLNNFQEALPRLVRRGLTAVFFVTASAVGEPMMMGLPELAELRKAGMEIGSHGMSHVLYSGLPRTRLEWELRESRRVLEAGLGAPVDFFSLPRGYLPRCLPRLAREAGYRGMCVSRPGRNRAATDPFLWRRLTVRCGDGPELLAGLWGRWGAGYLRWYLREKVRTLARRRFALLRPPAPDVSPGI